MAIHAGLLTGDVSERSRREPCGSPGRWLWTEERPGEDSESEAPDVPARGTAGGRVAGRGPSSKGFPSGKVRVASEGPQQR